MLKPKFRTAGLAVLLTALLAGCSQNSSSSAPSTTGDDENSPVTFSYYMFSPGKKDVLASETTIGKVLQEQTGVDWKLEYLVGDSATKAGVMIASGDYPDVISSSGEMSKLLDAGAYIPLDDLIEEYGPNIKRVYGPYFDKMKNAEDGKIYALPYTANQGEYSGSPNVGGGAFWIQRSVLKEFDYPKITTLDEYFDLIQDYKEKHPTVDGAETIGFVSLAGVANNFFTLQNPAMHLAGYPNDGSVMVDMTNHEAKVVAGTDAQKKWIQKLNEINAQGMLDPESFTMNKDQYLAKLTSGRVLGYFNYGWQVGDASKNLLSAGIDEKRYAPLPIVFDEGIKDQYVDPPGFVNNYATGISVNAKDPVRIIKYFDNLLKEENQVLVQWGIKDETYSVDDKGRFYFANEDQRKAHDDLELSRKFGFTYFGSDWPRYGGESTLTDGNAYSPGNQPEVAAASYTEGDKKFLEAYGIQTFSELFNKPEERPWFPAWSIALEQGSPEQIFTTKSDDLQRKYLPEMILGAPSNFDKLWDAYMAELNKLDKAGYEATITKVVKDRVAGKW
ncbi:MULTISPECIES: ABC transporter substrate-binding protein [Paenibacillus]|uniref:ABC transporter substrate-binding protein n=1 Tax=Paenibacillus TaxID=44249 RepID=UPI00201E5DA5|nr:MULTISPECIES: ABC transporter substrate-binding protein [Paenibacillus]MCL6658642.1 ABC transporter substrate-binding protein [Paenibacillus amylolyticus]WJM11121.1 ABC transporter substrate-binding protein [Paenibacillus sp. PK1-4R]